MGIVTFASYHIDELEVMVNAWLSRNDKCETCDACLAVKPDGQIVYTFHYTDWDVRLMYRPMNAEVTA